MGISTVQYRICIGLNNMLKMVTVYHSLSLNMCLVLMPSILIILLLLFISGTVELNPGPPVTRKLKNLTACHINIRSLTLSKLRAIKTDISTQHDIITISETFLNENSTTDLSLPGFHKIIRKDRQRFGGGVAVYVKENITFKRKCQYENDNLEAIWIELNTIEGKILICTIYRPPNAVDFWDSFERNIELVKSN